MPKVRSSLKLVKQDAKPASSYLQKDLPLHIVNHIKKEFSLKNNAAKAEGMKKYMRNKFEFCGLQSPERRAIQRQVMTNYPKLDAECLWEVIRLSWAEDYREMHHFAVDCATHNKKCFCVDNKTCIKTLENIKMYLASDKSWWDTVDSFSGGFLVSQSPSDLTPLMDQWINDEVMWVRRSAILHQLRYQKETDKNRLFRYCLLRAHEEEFFIQKAMGWALRTYFRTDPKSVKDFVKKNAGVLPKLTQREALKHA